VAFKVEAGDNRETKTKQWMTNLVIRL